MLENSFAVVDSISMVSVCCWCKRETNNCWQKKHVSCDWCF